MTVLTRRAVVAAAAALPVAGVSAHADPRDRLVAAYPQFLEAATANGIRWRDGTVMAWDGGRANVSFEQKLANPSLADQMSLTYPRGAQTASPPVDFDPGRFRNLTFFKKMYGATAAAVERQLVPVPWRIGNYAGVLGFTRVNGVDRIVTRLVTDLAGLPPALHRYLVPPEGSFNWRAIAGTESLSAHAFGIAVDINTHFSDYWRWTGGSWRNRIPNAIVKVFERHGFIWGGKWFHYDTMHFEYRPELL